MEWGGRRLKEGGGRGGSPDVVGWSGRRQYRIYGELTNDDVIIGAILFPNQPPVLCNRSIAIRT